MEDVTVNSTKGLRLRNPWRVGLLKARAALDLIRTPLSEQDLCPFSPVKSQHRLIVILEDKEGAGCEKR